MHKFRYYLVKKARIDRIFEEFDTNHNGKLEPDELKTFLQSIENKAKREVFGLLVKFTVSDEDVEFILKDCDRRAPASNVEDGASTRRGTAVRVQA